MSQKFKNLFLAVSGISVFGSALTNICLLSIAAQKNSISGVTWIIISGYIGMSASGLLNGLLSRHFGHTNLLKTCEALRFVVLGLLFVFPLDSIINYILITFEIYI